MYFMKMFCAKVGEEILMKKRASVFAFYDKDGIVDDYVIVLLQAVKKHIEFQVVVVNGDVDKASLNKLNAVADKVLIRENNGLDVMAYVHGFFENYEFFKVFDEVIFYNQTVFGPFSDFDIVFEKMQAKNVDFWGITKHHESKRIPFWLENYDIIPEHVQSYFLVLSNKLFTSVEFKDFMQNLSITDYYSAVSSFEVPFTKHFKEHGYSYDTYIDTDKYNANSGYVLVDSATELIKDGMPIAKRKCFLLDRTGGDAKKTQKLYEYITKNTTYDFNLILKNLCRTVDNRTLNHSFNSCFNLNNYEDKNASTLYYVYIESAESVDYIKNKIKFLKNKIILLKDDYLKQNFENEKVIITQNPYKTIFNDNKIELEKNDYIAFITNNISSMEKGVFDVACLENIFEQLTQEQKLVALFEKNIYHGVASVLPSYKGENFISEAEFESFAESFYNVLATHSINIKTGKTSPVICQAESFFAKTSAIKKLSCFDFASLDKRFNRFLPSVIAQSEGCLSAYLFNDKTINSNVLDLYDMLYEVKKICGDEAKSFHLLTHNIPPKLKYYEENHNDITLKKVFESKNTLKQKLYIIKNLFFYKK